MVDQVARALCDAAGRSIYRGEARAAIQAAHDWYRKERRWPSFVSRQRDRA